MTFPKGSGNMLNRIPTIRIVRGALVAGVYAAVTMLFAPLSFGPVQVRVSEALTLLPWLWIEAVPGLFIGCIIANFMGGFGIIDVIFGSAATLAAALLTSRMPSRYLAAVPPVVINALVVGGYLSILLELPVLPTMLYVGLGQTVACCGLGIPLLTVIERRSSR
ncbi:MAG: QueT transporter family protein [Thermovirgaceae bacterium]|nr:QueT transporter family protein [Thermovirgaceae bacterium]